MNKQRNTTLDILKAFACVHVVMIHAVFPDPVRLGVRSSGCFAVPLFFCISGYFFSSHKTPDASSIARKLRHIVGLIFASEVFYIVFAILYHGLWNQDNLNNFWVAYFKQGWIEKYFISNQPPAYAHLWFLYALATLYIVSLVFLNTRRRIHIAYLTIPVSLITIILLQEFGFLHIIRNTFRIPGRVSDLLRSSFFFYRALPFFLFGILLKEMEVKNKRLLQPTPAKLRLFPLLMIVFQICAVVEGYAFSIAQFYLGSMLLMATMMIYAIMRPNVHCKPMEFIGDKLSTYVYILHVAVMKIWDSVTGKLHIADRPLVKWTRPLMTVVLSLIISYIVYYILEQIRTKHSRGVIGKDVQELTDRA